MLSAFVQTHTIPRSEIREAGDFGGFHPMHRNFDWLINLLRWRGHFINRQ